MTKREFLDTVFALVPNEANKIMDAFDEYVDSNEPRWIPVTERLPEINEDILLSYFDEVTIGWLCGDGSWMIFDGQECASADEISAWMPLPEPYKPTVPPECEGDCGWCKPSVIEKCKGVTE